MAADTPSVRWDENGRPHWTHRCVTGAVEVQLPLAPDCWQKGDGDTLTPSINCQDCRTHGFWTNGQWWWSGVPRDVADALAERRADADFRARVDHRLRADRRILDRLKDGRPVTAADHATAVQLLRSAAADHLTHLHPDERDELVERITGAIDRCARKRAAAELRAFAAHLESYGGPDYTTRALRGRADALDSQ